MRAFKPLVVSLALLCFQGSSPAAELALPALAEPVKVLAGDKPIAVEIGHASPFVIDINNDRKNDLLVGQYGGGKCRVYLNAGTNTQPKFDNYTFLQANGTDATVPPS